MPKPPSWNEIRSNAAAFASRWATETDENAGAQSFWNEFLGIFGVDRKRVATFEARAKRTSTGGRGRIDLLWPNVLVAEHKSAGKSLADAEQQALDYLDSIDEDRFPGVVITSDFARMRVLDLGGDRTPHEFPLIDLVREIDRFGFIAGYKKRDFGEEQEAQANIEAARLMGRLYEQLSKNGYEGHDASVLLTRLLFLLFGDDTGMWEKSLFHEFLATRTQPDGTDVGGQLATLFRVLDRDDKQRSGALDDLLRRFPFVNGGLFHDLIDIPTFDREMRDELLACCHFDWGSISPAIFGSMFQAVKSKEARRELGEHYTTERSILRLVGPLFLDGLWAEFDAARDNVNRLRRLRDRLGTLRFLDPAAGCGNFLVVSYRELRRLELEILKRLRDLTGDNQLSMDATLGLQVSLDHFFGIEVEEWPARIAETAMFLVDHQANLELAQEFGQAPDRLPIDITATIVQADAALLDWNAVLPAAECTYVLGNPPYSGGLRLTPEQKAGRETVYQALPVPVHNYGRLDYVTVWLAKAMAYLRGTVGQAAFVMTNSVTQGEQARSLGPLLRAMGYRIMFAHRTFGWTSEAPGAANVHVVIIGIAPVPARESSSPPRRRLFDYASLNGAPTEIAARNINMWLLDDDDFDVAKHQVPLVPGLPMLTVGSQPTDGGGLTVTPAQVDEVRVDPIAAKYLRRFIGADEMLYRRDRWCLWLVNVTPAEVRASPVLAARMDIVRAARQESPTPAFKKAANTPHLFTHRKHPNTGYLALPQTSSAARRYVPAEYQDETTIASNKLMIVPDAHLWVFGVIESSMWMAWLVTFGGRLKSDLNVTADLVYNAFPWPDLTDRQRAAIEKAAQAVLDARAAHPESTLADLYDPKSMPADLTAAHNKLDRAVELAYGLRVAPTDRQRLAALVARYRDLVAPLDADAEAAS